MLILYYKPTCVFSRQVIATASRLEQELDLRDITADAGHDHDLIARGGRHQVPYLVDEEQGVEMYESEAIIAHLQKHYGTGVSSVTASARPRVHVGGSVCVSCEG